MKYITPILFLCFIFVYGCSFSHESSRISLIKKFSERLNKETGIILQHTATSTYLREIA